MIINTYDDKEEAKYDLKGLEKYFQSCIEVQEHREKVEVAKSQAYLAGYRDALWTAAKILGASNYRVAEETEKVGD